MLALLYIMVLIGVITYYKRTCDKFDSNQFLWVTYALIGYGLGFCIEFAYVLLLHENMIGLLGKKIATTVFIPISLLSYILAAFLFHKCLNMIYRKRFKRLKGKDIR